MIENKNNRIHDEELDKVTGGALLDSGKKWADDKLWYIIQKDGDWQDVVEEIFPLFEGYCERQNATPERAEAHMKITPRDLEEYMLNRFFVLGDIYMENGCRRPKGY